MNLHDVLLWIAHKSHRVEHLGFVAYAGCEVFALHNVLFFISAWLFIAGVAAYLTDGKVN